MRVAIAGASGLIGTALAQELRRGGHDILRLVRRPPSGAEEIRWDPASGIVDTGGLRRADAVVNLAGEPIARRWTAARKRRIYASRVDGTRLLAATMAGMETGPRVFVFGSGIHFYGVDRDDEVLSEESAPGSGFLAKVVRDWEGAADPARHAGLRVANVRTGIVQSPKAMPLQLQLPLFRLGLGGRLGSGRQWFPWITLDDLVGIFAHAVTTPEVDGVLNGASPNPVRNAEYTHVLARVLRRPALIPVPWIGPALLLGRELADELAFANLRVLPTRTLASGYTFRHPDLEAGLRAVLGR
jgi:uncharacterized protein (TIGR01777 family)